MRSLYCVSMARRFSFIVTAEKDGDGYVLSGKKNVVLAGDSADRIFVMTVRSSAPGNEFDDIVMWIPMPTLVARMVASGQLP